LLCFGEVDLQDCKTLSKCMDDFGRELPFVDEDEMRALQEGEEITEITVKWLLIDPLDDSIETIHKVFLLDVEGGTSTYLDNLKNAK